MLILEDVKVVDPGKSDIVCDIHLETICLMTVYKNEIKKGKEVEYKPDPTKTILYLANGRVIVVEKSLKSIRQMMKSSR